MSYEFLEHTADLKIKAVAKNIEEGFKEAVYGLKQAIAEDIKVKTIINREIEIESEDKKSLLYDFLEEFLYLLDAEDFLISKINKLEIRENNKNKKKKYVLKAEITGDKASNYKFVNNVKAITYNQMDISEEKGKTTIIYVVDV